MPLINAFVISSLLYWSRLSGPKNPRWRNKQAKSSSDHTVETGKSTSDMVTILVLFEKYVFLLMSFKDPNFQLLTRIRIFVFNDVMMMQAFF